MRNTLLFGILLVTLGCASMPSAVGVYQGPPSKHPWVFSVNGDGTYVLERARQPATRQTGRWWQVAADLLVLLPDNEKSKQCFVRINEKDPLRPLLFSNDLRKLMELTASEAPSPEPVAPESAKAPSPVPVAPRAAKAPTVEPDAVDMLPAADEPESVKRELTR